MDGSKSFCADDDTELSPDEIEMLSLLPDELLMLPDSLEQYLFNLESSQPPTNLDHFELAENPNINLYDPVLNVDANLDLFELAVNPNINLYDHVLSSRQQSCCTIWWCFK